MKKAGNLSEDGRAMREKHEKMLLSTLTEVNEKFNSMNDTMEHLLAAT